MFHTKDQICSVPSLGLIRPIVASPKGGSILAGESTGGKDQADHMTVVPYGWAVVSVDVREESCYHPPSLKPKRNMASNHPIHIHPARPLYRFTATALGASMWFFLMYRAKKDGPALLGWKHPWDH
ncbi:uncharacterized protein LDX57_012360 [Aspergillus melleus]|nr:uncharacterized protein LDX57_012360 [Aspergillus melleus]KAH8434721.1 hypothetical protein LDX57_012360 [Aspergillus melleus]